MDHRVPGGRHPANTGASSAGERALHVAVFRVGETGSRHRQRGPQVWRQRVLSRGLVGSLE